MTTLAIDSVKLGEKVSDVVNKELRNPKQTLSKDILRILNNLTVFYWNEQTETFEEQILLGKEADGKNRLLDFFQKLNDLLNRNNEKTSSFSQDLVNALDTDDTDTITDFLANTYGDFDPIPKILKTTTQSMILVVVVFAKMIMQINKQNIMFKDSKTDCWKVQLFLGSSEPHVVHKRKEQVILPQTDKSLLATKPFIEIFKFEWQLTFSFDSNSYNLKSCSVKLTNSIFDNNTGETYDKEMKILNDIFQCFVSFSEQGIKSIQQPQQQQQPQLSPLSNNNDPQQPVVDLASNNSSPKNTNGKPEIPLLRGLIDGWNKNNNNNNNVTNDKNILTNGMNGNLVSPVKSTSSTGLQKQQQQQQQTTLFENATKTPTSSLSTVSCSSTTTTTSSASESLSNSLESSANSSSDLKNRQKTYEIHLQQQRSMLKPTNTGVSVSGTTMNKLSLGVTTTTTANNNNNNNNNNNSNVIENRKVFLQQNQIIGRPPAHSTATTTATSSSLSNSTGITTVPIIHNIAAASNNITNSNNNNSSSVSFALQTARARSSKKCVFCSKTVYDMELIEVNQKYYHNYCFKCKQCKTNLSVFNFHSHKDNIYCATHYRTVVLQAENIINK